MEASVILWSFLETHSEEFSPNPTGDDSTIKGLFVY